MYTTENVVLLGAKVMVVGALASVPDVALTAQGGALSCWVPGFCNGPASCAGFNNEWVGNCTVRCEYSGGVGYAVCSGT
jgi:hypothetical protein